MRVCQWECFCLSRRYIFRSLVSVLWGNSGDRHSTPSLMETLAWTGLWRCRVDSFDRRAEGMATLLLRCTSSVIAGVEQLASCFRKGGDNRMKHKI
ncbi:uncharacterized protein CIMG_13568 [Coccidioides immitis RS]|uniref:Uncharacterized protein n=1 Tax=Coccidioides immitis (strain RS) TaxID=246410 RepID=A0A0D8JVF4_COCIM|nr:uncharacterized protein CIMG_13568 [Coccidioides immitis RS]KJF61310.1 hypothetical protein CIMG_13568 [Coccidioides immitis RS]